MMKKAKIAILLVLALVFAVHGIGMPVAKAEAWTANDVTYANLMEGLGLAASTGVVTGTFYQDGHSESNIIADKIVREGGESNPLFVSGRGNHAMGYGVTVTLELPEFHLANEMTFRLYTYENGQYEPTDMMKTVPVAGKTEVTIDFGEVKDPDLYSKNLYVFQTEAGQIVDETETNRAGLTPEYGDPVSGGDGGYVYIGTLENLGKPNPECKLLQNPGEYTGKNGEEGYISDLHFGPNIALYKLENGNYVPLADSAGKMPDGTTGTMQAADVVYIRDSSWDPDVYKAWGSDVYLKLMQVTCDGNSYLCYGDHKFNIIYEESATVATDMLKELSDLSWNLANSSLSLGGNLAAGVHFGDTPMETGNAEKKGTMTDGMVVSLYGIQAGKNNQQEKQAIVNQEILMGLDSTEDQKSHVKEKGVPIADNEYVVFNVVVPEGCESVSFAGATIGFKTSNGTVQSADKWDAGTVESLSRVIWNVVTQKGSEYVPYEGTVYNGECQGGLLLAPKATIEVTATANAQSIVGKTVQMHSQELHQISMDSASTYVRMTNKPAVDMKGTKHWNDAGNEDKRPKEIKVELYASMYQGRRLDGREIWEDVLVKTFTVDADDNWSWEIEGLPKAYNGKNIGYWVKEIVDFNGYTFEYGNKIFKKDGQTVAGSNPADYDEIRMDLTNNYDAEAITVKGKKTWEDADNQDGKRPASITVQIQGSFVKNGADNWYDWQKLSEYDGFKDYEDTITVDADDDWSWVFENLKTKYYNNNDQYEWKYRVIETKFGNKPIHEHNALISGGDVKTGPADKDDTGYDVTYSNNGEDTDRIGDAYNITNTHVPEKIKLEGQKVWVPADFKDKPQRVTVNLYTVDPEDGTEKDTGKSCEVNESNNWTWTFADLDKYENGVEIQYTVKENNPPQGFWQETYTAPNGQITLYNIAKDIRISGWKEWKDTNGNDRDPMDVDKVEIYIYQKNGTPDTADDTLVATVNPGKHQQMWNGKNWSWSVELPGYTPDGKDVEYYLVEKPVPNYTSSIDRQPDGTSTNYREDQIWKVTNTHETIDLTVEKVWDDGDASMRPSKIQFILLRDGSPLYNNNGAPLAVEYNVANPPSEPIKFTNLDEFKADGTKYEYNIKEQFWVVEQYNSYWSDTYPGYTSSTEITPDGEDGDQLCTVTNAIEKVAISGTKTWNYFHPFIGHPTTVNLKVKYNNGTEDVVYTTKEITGGASADTWNWTIDNLPKYINGQLAEYTIEEEYIPGYVPEVTGNMTDGFVVSNTGARLIDVSVTKQWEDNNDPARPTSVQVRLLRNGSPMEGNQYTVTLSEANGWTHTFSNLFVYSGPNGTYEYSVEEINVPSGYKVSISGDAGNGFVVKNTKEQAPEVVTVSVNKVWNVPDGNATEQPTSVTVYLLANGNPVTDSEKVLNAANNWATEWPNLRKLDDEGEMIVYTVDENCPDQYIKRIARDAENQFTITNTYVEQDQQLSFTIPVEKVLDGGNVEETFEFVLSAPSYPPAPLPEDITAAVFGAGEVTDDPFGEIVIDYVNDFNVDRNGADYVMYRWVVNEVIPDEDKRNPSVEEYDTTHYTVEAIVMLDANGQMCFGKKVYDEATGRDVLVRTDKVAVYSNENSKTYVAPADISPLEFTNKVTSTSITVTKQWRNGKPAAANLSEKLELWRTYAGLETPEKVTGELGVPRYDETTEKYTWSGLPTHKQLTTGTGEDAKREWKQYTYYVKEQTVPGYTTTYNNPNSSDADKAYDGGTITNTYTATGSTTLAVEKTLTGRDSQEGDSFTFTLTAEDGAPMPEENGRTVTLTWDSQKGEMVSTGTFGKIEYSIADMMDADGERLNEKEYTYIITESTGDLPNVTYDTTGHEVTVTITDNGDGTLSVVPNYGDGKNAVEITNTYTATGSTTLAVEKTLAGGRGFQEGDSFTFTLTASEGAPMPAEGGDEIVLAWTDGAMVSTGTFGPIYFTQEHADNTDPYTYTVTETAEIVGVVNDSKTHTVDVKVTDNGDGTLSINKTYKNGADEGGEALIFVNTVISGAQKQFALEKTVEVAGNVEPTGEEEFDIIVDDGTKQAAIPLKAGKTVNFITPEFRQAGMTAVYTIYEDTTAKLPGFIYSEAKYRVTYTSKLEGAQVVVDEAWDAWDAERAEWVKQEAALTVLEFTNTYEVNHADLTLTKKLVGVEQNSDLVFDFTITLKDAAGALVNETFAMSMNGSDETIEFTDGKATVAFGVNKDGVSDTVVIKGLRDGMTYTVEEKDLPAYTETYSPAASGTIDASSETNYAVETTNTLVKTSVQVQKVWAEDKAPADKDISAYLKLYAGDTNVTATYADKLEINEEKTTYTWKDLPKYKIDEVGNASLIKYTVKEDMPGYSANVETNEETGAITITNTKLEGSHELKVIKSLTNSSMDAMELQTAPMKFSFVLEALSGTDTEGYTVTPAVGKVDIEFNEEISAGASAEKSALFTIDFLKPGTYKFKVSEAANDYADVWEDGAVYFVTYVVDNNMDVQVSYAEEADGAALDKETLDFTNAYIRVNTDVNISKTYNGTERERFTFTLTEVDAEGATVDGGLTEDRTIFASNGAAEEDLIWLEYGYDDVGETFYYLIAEKADANKPEIVYDSSKYWLRVKVSKQENAAGLAISKNLVKAESIPADEAGWKSELKKAEFTNAYVEAEVEFTATKKFIDSNGNAIDLAADQFSFTLKKMGETEPPRTAKNDADGNIAFDVKYTLADMVDATEKNGKLRKEINYVIAEVANSKDDGITYDTKVYAVTAVLVYDEETNTLTATAAYVGEDAADPPVFTNTKQAVEEKSYSVELEKADKLDPSKKLKDAQYTLYTKETCTEEDILVLPDGTKAIITTDANGLGTLTNVPAGTYWVKETGAPDGYQVDPEAYPITVPNAENPDAPVKVQVKDYPETSVAVKKVWEGVAEDAVLPEITVQLVADGNAVEGKTLKLNAACNWAGEFTELDSYNELTDEPIVYTVKEIAVDGYDTVITGDAKEGFTITNTKKAEEKEKISIKVTKVWDDNNDAAQARPEKIVVKLLVGAGNLYEEVTLDETNNWTHTWEDLPAKNSQDKAYSYTVEEVTVDEDGQPLDWALLYTAKVTGSMVEGFTITNTLAKGDFEMEFTKSLVGGAELPEGETRTFTFKLYEFDNDVKGAEAGSTTITLPYNGSVEDVLGSITFDIKYGEHYYLLEEVPGEDADITYDSQKYKLMYYALVDRMPNGEQTGELVMEDYAWEYYPAKEDGAKPEKLHFTNTYEAPEKTSITVTKVWDDNDNAAGKRPESIQVVLTMGGGRPPVDAGNAVKVLNEANNWTYTWNDLDVYDGSGNRLEYTVIEKIPGDAAEYYVGTTTAAENGFILTNTYVAEEKLGLLKLCKSDRLNPNKKLEGAQYTLFTQETCKEEEILVLPDGTKAIITTGADGWGTLTGVPSGTYWVKETKAPVGYEVDPEPYKVEVKAEAEEPVQVQVSDFPLRGALSLSKTVVADSETDESFLFDIELSRTDSDPIAGSYEATLNGVATDKVIFVAEGKTAKATVSLKDGETLVIHGLRAGTTYLVSEQPNERYDVQINGVAATSAVGTISDTALSVAKFQNTLKLVGFTVKKEWTGLAEGETTPAIKLTLYCNGKAYPAVTPAPDKNGWYTYTGLPAYVDGKLAVYTVKEEPVTGFTTTYLNKSENAAVTDCAHNGSTIVNSKIPQTGDTTPLTLWMLTSLLAAFGLLGVTAKLRKREN